MGFKDAADTLKTILNPFIQIGDIASGGALSNWMGKADREADMADWQEKMKSTNEYQQDFLKFQNEENLKYNQLLTQFNNQESMKMSKEMAHFNWTNFESPEAKMNALKTAGINPNLVAGQMNGTDPSQTMNSSSTSGGGSGSISTPVGRVSNTIGKTFDLLYQTEMLENQRLINAHQRLENDKLQKEQPYFALNAKNQAQAFANGNTLTLTQIKEIQEVIKDHEWYRKDVESQLVQRGVLNQKTMQEINNLVLEEDFIRASTDEKVKMLKKIDSDIKVGTAMVAMLSSQSNYLDALEGLTRDQRGALVYEISKIDSETKLNQVKKKILAYEAGKTEDLRKPIEDLFSLFGRLFSAGVSLKI